MKMLKTNSKKAVSNIQDYIMSCFIDPASLGYDGIETPLIYREIKKAVEK